MSYIKFVLFGLLILAGTSCAHPEKETSRQETEIIPVRLLSLAPSLSNGAIKSSGRFTTDDEVFLSFKTGGVIHKILVREGDAIHTGQLLATLNLTEINTQVAQASAAHAKADRDYQRTTNLFKDSVASLEQLQNTRTALELSRQQLSAAQFNRNYSEIRATQNGYVLRRMANDGQVVAAGVSVLQTNGAHKGNWFLRIGLSDKDWSAVRLQDKAKVHADAAPGKQLDGIVYRKSEAADPATGLFSIDIKITGDQEGSIASGMFGSATILTQGQLKNNAEQLWAIPYDALLDGDGSSGYVFITDDKKTAQKVKVTIAAMEKDRIMISGGLQNATSLIISGSAYLTDKSKIRIVE